MNIADPDQWRGRNRQDVEMYRGLIASAISDDLERLHKMKDIYEEYVEEMQADQEDNEDFVYKVTPAEDRVATNS